MKRERERERKRERERERERALPTGTLPAAGDIPTVPDASGPDNVPAVLAGSSVGVDRDISAVLATFQAFSRQFPAVLAGSSQLSGGRLLEYLPGPYYGKRRVSCASDKAGLADGRRARVQPG